MRTAHSPEVLVLREPRPARRPVVPLAPALPDLADAPPRARGAALVPALPEIAALLAAAERVLLTCAEVEDDRGRRLLSVAAALDPTLTPPAALLGPGLPRPLADRVALRALRRLALALHPSVPGDVGGWWAPGGHEPVVEFRAVVVDARDLPLLADAAAHLSHSRRSREGALALVRERLGEDVGEPDEPVTDRHPDALGCLLATILPVDDPATVTVHRVAREAREARAAPGIVLDEPALAAHRALGARILRRL